LVFLSCETDFSPPEAKESLFEQRVFELGKLKSDAANMKNLL
jgi:hypothetical protein